MSAAVNGNAGLAPGASDNTSTTTQASPQYSPDSRARKAVAVWLYQSGVCSLDETLAKFEAHPRWRAA